MTEAPTADQESQRETWRYSLIPGHWDEAFRESGLPRRHWRKLAAAVRSMGFEQLTRRWRAGQHLLQANGVTYNVYGDAKGSERPWSLDPLPLVMDEREWASIERAIAQRATLLNAILADLYGPRRLLHDRSLPPAVGFGNPGFLRPCHGIRPRGGVFLHFYAADLGRSPDGSWWVISDRAQAPSGMGYALENRLVTARTLPAAFDQGNVRALGRFFDAARDAIAALSPRAAANPRVVLLTPGPHNETYFEHSFLARHWGFPLVEGGDLTVRDSKVYLKTLSGLQRVDVVLRRMDDSFCDPLELRGDSLLGVAGLTQAARAGNVTIANFLGSGVMESPAHMAFLPGLAQALLGEELRMPSVATWWCGQETERRWVIEHLDELVIKPAYPRFGEHPHFPAFLDSAARRDLVRRIEASPDHWVAQEQVALSSAPVRTGAGIEPRHVVLRVFAAWDGSGYTILPGGLTRVSTLASSPVVSMQLGGGSKDTWVLGADPHPPLIRVEPAAAAPSAQTDLPSRVADNLFWLGRHAEGVESTVRLVRALLPGLSGEEDFGGAVSIDTVVHYLSALGFLPDSARAAPIAEQLWQTRRLLSSIIHDRNLKEGAGWGLAHVRRAARPVKERLSQDTWRVLQQLESDFGWTPPVSDENRLSAEAGLLDRAVVTLSAFAGLLSDNTTRGPGWRFLDSGRRMERSLRTLDLLDAALRADSAEVEDSLEVLLRIADSTMTYRSLYFDDIRPAPVVALLVANEANPRSVAFQLAALSGHTFELAGEGRLAELAREALRQARAADNGSMRNAGPAIKEILRSLSSEFEDRFFNHLLEVRLPDAP